MDNIFRDKEAQEKYIQQRVKIDQLLEQTGAIRKFKGEPVFVISAFILTSQYVEFTLRSFIFLLDSVTNMDLKGAKSKIERRPRRPEQFEKKTLGQTINAIKEFRGIITQDFKDELDKLNQLRIDFIHHLYSSSKSTSELITDSREGLKVCDSILDKKNLILDQLFAIDPSSPTAKAKIDEGTKSTTKK